MKKLIALILGIICTFTIAFTACTENDNSNNDDVNSGITNDDDNNNGGTTNDDDDDNNGGTTDDDDDDNNGGTTNDDDDDDDNGGTVGGDDQNDDDDNGGSDDKTDDNINRFPDFTVETYESAYKEGTFSLADYRGKVVVINFWYRSCGICVDEMPDLEKIKNNFGDDVVVLALHIDNGEQSSGQAFIDSNAPASHPLKNSWSNYNIIFGKDLSGSQIFKLCGGRSTCPYTAVLDKNGVICWTREGSFMYFDLETLKSTDYLSPVIEEALNK